jgi:ectoine hydroxylase-related dioxygenase (phytanoyl-CoA dioxygenase family)
MNIPLRQHFGLTPVEVARFWKHGFVRVPNLLPDNAVAELRDAMDHAMGTISASPNGYDATAVAEAFWSTEKAIDRQGSEQHDLDALAAAIRNSPFPRLVDERPDDVPPGHFFIDTGVWRREPRLAQIAVNSHLPETMAALLAVERLRYYDDQLFVKEAGAVDRVAFHQDLSYFNLGGDCGCVVWIPLDPVRRGGGAMGYVPGSHLWGRTYRPNVFLCELPVPGSEGTDLPRVDSCPEDFGVQYVEADPGDVIIHHFQTVHGSEGNGSRATRRAFSLRYCDADIRFLARSGAPAQPLHGKQMKNGDELDSKTHPLVWEMSEIRRPAA